MTRSDKWKQRPTVLRYRAFADELRYNAGLWKMPRAGIFLQFYIPMPRTWTKKDKARYDGEPHMDKPDIDNLIKAFFDALHTEDKTIWDIRASKRWATEGRIEVWETE